VLGLPDGITACLFDAEALREHGADVVVRELTELSERS
jgi:hypothetical protein